MLRNLIPTWCRFRGAVYKRQAYYIYRAGRQPDGPYSPAQIVSMMERKEILGAALVWCCLLYTSILVNILIHVILTLTRILPAIVLGE